MKNKLAIILIIFVGLPALAVVMKNSWDFHQTYIQSQIDAKAAKEKAVTDAAKAKKKSEVNEEVQKVREAVSELHVSLQESERLAQRVDGILNVADSITECSEQANEKLRERDALVELLTGATDDEDL